MELQEFNTASGCKIFQLPMQVFPGMNGFAYFMEVDGMRVLIDAGSGVLTSSEDLENGLKEAGRRLTGTPISFEDLTHILITHAHIDHFGGLVQVRPRTNAQLGVHELDQRIISHYEERVSVIARRLRNYLGEAGISEESRDRILEMYRINKSLFHSVPVDFTYEAIGMHLGPFEFLHVPGHCAGHVAIRLENVVFSGDHVLMGTSPHQSPEHLTLSTGLDHYLHSLDAFEAWAASASVVLGGHKRPITDIPGRCEEIRQVHRERLQKVLEVLREPHTIADVSRQLFKAVEGYNILLAIEETGAHVEYLYQRGTIEIANYEELESGEGTAILYKVSS
jgi:glyoxylase-like metal-dependent hydrolase (beta-lactamase superfamily II)